MTVGDEDDLSSRRSSLAQMLKRVCEDGSGEASFEDFELDLAAVDHGVDQVDPEAPIGTLTADIIARGWKDGPLTDIS